MQLARQAPARLELGVHGRCARGQRGAFDRRAGACDGQQVRQAEQLAPSCQVSSSNTESPPTIHTIGACGPRSARSSRSVSTV
jgi:hypothetical protein